MKRHFELKDKISAVNVSQDIPMGTFKYLDALCEAKRIAWEKVLKIRQLAMTMDANLIPLMRDGFK